MEHFQQSVVALIDHYGYLGLFVSLALGNLGLPIGTEIVLPLAGALTATGHLSNLGLTIAVSVAAELGGGSAGYAVGRFGGVPLIERYGKYIHFTHDRLMRMHRFFERWGTFAIFICRFLPVLRGIAAIPAGIAEMNLFILLSALGLSYTINDERLLPIGTVYDPFICRGLDALNYACYQNARFILVATPSGITLAPEGGAHQSISTPLIGMAQDGLAAFEPAFVDELAAIMGFALSDIQRDGEGEPSERNWLRDETGGSVYLRLSTRPIDQPQRTIDPDLAEAIVAGGYWLREPAEGTELAIAYCGAVAPEALAAHQAVAEDIPGAALLAITSPDRLHRDWRAARQGGESSVAERLLARLRPGAALVTVGDFHPATLSWLGAVAGNAIVPLGVDRFGQSGDIPDLYRAYGIDRDAILDAAACACLTALRRNV